MGELEVEQGKCNLRQDDIGRVLRVVQVMALELVRSDGSLCVKVGDWKYSETHPGIVLPGTKIRKDELPVTARQRFLMENLAELPGRIEFTVREVIEEVKPSPQYGLRTKYVKTIFSCNVVDGNEAMGGARTVLWE